MAVVTPPRRTFRWRWPWFVAIIAAVIVLVASLGIIMGTGLFPQRGSPGQSAAVSPSASAMPTPAQSPTPTPLEALVVVQDNNSPGGLHLMTLGGVEVSAFKPSSNQQVMFIGAGGQRAVFLLNTMQITSSGQITSDDFTINALHRDGSLETLQSFGARQPGRVVISPDGLQWLWSDYTVTGNNWHSMLHLSAAGGQNRVIASLDSPDHVIAPYRWDGGGAVVAHQPIGIGGTLPLGWGAMGDSFLLDVPSGTLSPLWQYGYGNANDCNLHARAADGTIACLARSATGGYTIKIGKPPTLALAIPLNQTRFLGAGSISFKPGPTASLVAIGGCTLSWQQCSTDLIDVQTGSIWRFGTDGLSPRDGGWVWLDDGSLITVSEAGWNGLTAPPAAYIVSPQGSARQLAPGVPVGVLLG